MPFVHGLGERIGNAGPDPDQRRLLDAELGRNLIGGDKADPPNVASQAVRVLGDQLNGIGSVGLIDPYGSRGSDAVAMEEQHDLADDLLLGPARDDLSCTLGADAGHFAQTSRLLLDNLKDVFAECPDKLPGIDRADAADHPGAEIFFDALGGRRWRDLEEQGPELHAVNAVVHPGPARLDKLAGRNGRSMAEHSNQITLTARLDAQQDRKSTRLNSSH